MIVVSVHPDVEYQDVATRYAAMLQDWKNTHRQPPRFGATGQWEDNPRLMSSLVFKTHIKMPLDSLWPAHLAVAARKSDNYLVYCVHWCDDTRFQVLSIMSPDAHAMARTSFMAEIERRAEQFQNT